MGWKDKVSFPSKFSRNCHKRLVPKTVRHDQWEMFVTLSFRHRLICFLDFVRTFLLACVTSMTTFHFCYHYPAFFSGFIFPHSLQLWWKFSTTKTSAISGTEISHKSETTCFEAGTRFHCKNGIAFLPIACAIAPNPLPRFLPILLKNGISICLAATFL